MTDERLLTGEMFELTERQRRAFLKLKRAYEECKKAGVYFYDNYGELSAVDSDKIECYNDNSENGILDNGGNPNTFNIPVSWADDPHYFHINKESNSKIR
jgi:hypothetical protein